jgi:chromosome segregation ATPase
MTHQDSQELKTYLEQQFGEVRERFTKVDGRLGGLDGRLDGMDRRFDGVDARLAGMDTRLAGIDTRLAGIDTHLDRQDIDFNQTTKNLLLTIQDATKESRSYAARLFGILDRPLLDTEDVPKPAKSSRPRHPRQRSGR